MSVIIKSPTGVPAKESKIKTDGSISGSSFKRVDRPVKRRLIVSVEGQEKQGKTHFSMTAPGPIGYLDLDIGGEGVVDKFTAQKEIHQAEFRLSFPFQQSVADQAWKQFVNDYKAALGSPLRTVVVDTADEAWELLRIAKFGKLSQIMPHLYGPVNAEMRELYRLAYDSDINLVLIHKVKKEYVNEQWTGKYERAGFSATGFMVQVAVRAFKQDGQYKLEVLTCRQNPAIEGQILDNDFTKLGMAVFPGTVEDDWR